MSPFRLFSLVMGFLLVISMLLPGFAQSFEPDAATRAYLDLWRRGRYTEALERLEREIERSVDGVPILWLQDRALLMFEQGQYLDAVAHLEWLHQRRASPENTVQLALLYLETGNKIRAHQILGEVYERFKRASRYEDDTDNDLALQRIRELQGDNPRDLLKTILSYLPREKTPDHIKRHLAAGQLAFRKGDWALAADQFEKVLSLDPEQVDGLAGLAECFWQSGDPALDETLAKVLAINPVHPTARAIEIERALDANHPERVLGQINQMLTINPASLRFLGYKAAALFLLDRPLEMNNSLTDALLINPRASMPYRITARIAARHYRFEESSRFLQEALTLDPEDHEARALYAFNLLRLGRDQEGRRQLDLAFERDRFNVQVFNMLELLDTLEKFTVLETDRVQVKMPAKEAGIWGEEVLEVLDRAQASFEERYQIKLKQPTMVQIFDNHDDFMVRSVGLPGNVGHLGICFGQLITMDSPTARDKWGMNWRSVLWHEFVHVVTLQKTGNRMSRWLSEGISVYEETLEDSSWGQRLHPAFKLVTLEGKLPGIAEMEGLFTNARSANHLVFGYYASARFVSFYVETYGFQNLLVALDLIRNGLGTHHALLLAAAGDAAKTKTVLEKIKNGVAADQAIRQATNDIEARLNKKFRDRLEQDLKPLENLPMAEAPSGSNPRAPEQVISPFTDAMERGRRAEKEENWDKAEKDYQAAQKLFPEYPGADGPIQQLINLYRKWGRRDKLKESLQFSLSLNAEDFASCMALADLYREERDWPRMLEVARKALDIDPFDVAMNRTLLEAMKKAEQDGALKVLDRLLRLDPNHAIDYRLERIDLLRPKDPGRARLETLQLLEEIPWSWEAQRRLLQIVDGGRQ